MIRIIVVGQTPPPYGGQALMIERMLGYSYRNAKLFHVRMAFSQDMSQLGQFNFRKVLHIFELIGKIIFLKFRYKASAIYYPPSATGFFPVARDVVILFCTRWLFRSTIFHFHAAGISDFYKKIPYAFRPFFWIAFNKPAVSISPSRHNPEDWVFLSSKKNFIVPNGIPDEAAGVLHRPSSSKFRILFVGVVTASKGIEVLVEAAHLFKNDFSNFEVFVMGKFESNSYEYYLREKIDNLGLTDNFEFTGVLVGQDKKNIFLKSDVFCLPTYFESESFSLVTLEAMSFGLPLIVTKWRGVQSLIVEGVNGYAVPIKDSSSVSDSLSKLAADHDLRINMGREGRIMFERDFSVSKFHESMDMVFGEVV